jgi:16S rRNA (cytosine967-C5)-methyltransferase
MARTLRAERAPSGALVRAEAARIVARVVAEHRPAEAVLESASVPERDRGLLSALVYEALRWHHRLEWQAAQLLDRPLDSAELAALLRIGLVQLQQLRIPPHAAVSATVGAADLLGRGRARGVVNAVLRRFLRERIQIEQRTAEATIARFSHPAWLIDAIRADWSADWERILLANNAHAPMWLRVNRRATTMADYLGTLAAAGIPARAHPPDAVLLDAPVTTATLPGYALGQVSVQDASAQLAADYLDLQPGLRVLDACAAPGGKTAHILERCPELEEVVAIDRDGARMQTLRSNLERLGLAATLLQADAQVPPQWWDERPFDRILLDAPCSALGVIRRHPDIKILRTPADVARVVDLQQRLLDALWPLLVPGGTLVYATCTILSRENGAQIEAFCARTGDTESTGPGPHRGVQRLPGEANGDGFYYACLKKQKQ